MSWLSTKLATLKKLSARRKYPRRGLRIARTGSSAPPRTECGTAGRCPNRSSSPPSAANPIAAAMASMIVDLPVPLSPASSVTGVERSRPSIAATAGTS
jgi:hypothetical protein